MGWWGTGRKTGERPRQSAPGRPNASVFSYYSGDRNNTPQRGEQPAERSKSLTERFPFLRLRYVPSLVALAAIVVSLLYMFWLDAKPIVHILPDNSAGYHSSDDYAKAAEAILRRSPFNRSKLTINTGKFKQDFVTQFPEVEDITIALPVMGRRPTVTIELLPPAAVLSNGSATYVLDSNGRAVLPLAQARSTLVQNLPVVQDEGGLTYAQGKILLTREHLAFITELAAQLKAKQVPVQSLVLPLIPNELHLRTSDKPYYVKFDLGGNARTQVGTYLAVRDKLAADHITPSEYIDVRVDEKAFYK